MSDEIKIKAVKGVFCLILLAVAATLIDNWFIFGGVFLMLWSNNIGR